MRRGIYVRSWRNIGLGGTLFCASIVASSMANLCLGSIHSWGKIIQSFTCMCVGGADARFSLEYFTSGKKNL